MWFWFDVVAAFLGGVALCVGTFLIYPPAGFLMVGVVLISIAYIRRALEVKADGAS